MARKRSKYEELINTLYYSKNLLTIKNKKEDLQTLVARAETVVHSYSKVRQP